jgi:hypothetical protein
VDQPACPTCGYDTAGLTPPDAAVAVRSFPRRLRELLVAAEDDEEGRSTRPGPDGWSAADHAAAAAAGLNQVAALLRQVSVSDDPVLQPPAPDAGTPSGASVAGALDALEAGSRALATAIDAVKGGDWRRVGHQLDGRAWTALDLARLGVHVGVHDLRAAERILADQRA